MSATDRQSRVVQRANELGFVRITDLADELGVTVVTIRRDLDVLSDRGLIRRVRGGVVPDAPFFPGPQEAAAVSLSDVLVGVLVPDASQHIANGVAGGASGGAYYFAEVLVGARRELESLGLRTRLMFSRGDAGADEGILRQQERQMALDMIANGAKGLLFSWAASGDESFEHLDWLADLPVPVVLMEREISESETLFGVSSVRCAHEVGAAEAVRMLHDFGHRRIALLTHHYSQTTSAILDGWRAITTECGVSGEHVYRAQELPGWPATDAVDAWLDEILDAGVTALLSHNDHNSLAVLERLRARNIAVPGDFSLVSYDDDFAAMFDPALTAVAPPRAYIGKVAARLLADLIEDPKGSGASHIRVKPRLVVRDSVGRAPSA